MKIKLNKKSIAACMLVGTMVVTASGSALAANVNNHARTTAKAVAIHCSQVGDMKSTFENALNTLVSKGTLTQDQANTILNSCEKMKAPAGVPNEKRTPQKDGGFFNQQVKNGTITQEQATAIDTAMKAARETKKPLSDVLSELVSSGVITQAQADALKGCMPGKEQPKEGGFFNQQVKNGTITQEQATAIDTAMKAARETKKPLSDVLSELVSSGVITQAQADALKGCMPGKEHPKAGGFLDQLVKNGTITQDQETAIQNEVTGK